MTFSGNEDGSTGLAWPSYFRPPLLVFALFLVWVWARYIQIGVRGGGILGKVRFEFVAGSALVLLCLWVLMSAPLAISRSRAVAIGISLLFVTMVIQVPFAANPGYAETIFMDRVIKFAFLALFIAALVRSPQGMSFFLAVFLVSVFWITQESVRGLVSGALVWQNQGIMRLHGAVPIYAHPNSLGGVAMGAVPYVVFMWGVWRRLWQRAALLALAGSSMLCVLYSGSRTSYVAMLSFLVFWFARSRHKVRWLVIGAVAAPLALAVLPEEYIERFRTIGAAEEDGSQTARKVIMNDAWIIFTENPAGVGLSCFPFVRHARFGRAQDTHNLYLEVATNLGVQGLVAFFLFVGAMMAGFFNAHRRFDLQAAALARMRISGTSPGFRRKLKQHRRDLQFLMAVADATAGFIFVRLVLGLFGMDLYEVYWWFGAGICIALLELVRGTRARTRVLGVAYERERQAAAEA